MSTSRPNPNRLYHVVELNFKGVFLQNLFSYNHGKPLLSGIIAIRNDGEYATFVFYAYGVDGLVSLYVDHDGKGIEDWFASQIEEEEGDDSYIDGGENEDEIDNLRDVESNMVVIQSMMMVKEVVMMDKTMMRWNSHLWILMHQEIENMVNKEMDKTM
ncbi:unnamed protein product [Lactuca virosa]|uniref:Uncharacterized protein n=1 Tax=Lactuca virosa TaxID=75947 RepID=A0AAU9MR25_9ASTR|nr:unnamed protein product [Lactuca virosa]